MLHDMSLQFRLSRMSDAELDHFRKCLLAEVNGVFFTTGQGQQQQRGQITEPLAHTFQDLQLEPDDARPPSLSGESPRLQIVDVE